MKNNKLFVIFILMLLEYSNLKCQPNTWSQKADILDGRSSAVGFGIGNKGYIGTGLDAITLLCKKDFWEYDPAINVWTQKADFGGTARTGAVGFSIDQKGYLGIGKQDSTLGFINDLWEYDPIFNSWLSKSAFPGSLRWGAVAFNIGTKGYIGIGWDDVSLIYSDFWEYNPGLDQWIQKLSFPGSVRFNAIGFGIGNVGYIGTGHDFSGNIYSDFWEYDPGMNQWTPKSDLGNSLKRYGAVGFSIGTKGYISTGYNSNYLHDLLEFNPASTVNGNDIHGHPMGEWIAKRDFIGPSRYLAVGFNIGGNGYIGTGKDANIRYNDFYEYTPEPSIVTMHETICINQNASVIFVDTLLMGNCSRNLQWYYKSGLANSPIGSSTTGWTIIPGANSSNYTPSNSIAGDRTYACIVHRNTPCNDDYWAYGSRQETVNSNTTAVFISFNSGTNPMCLGDTAAFIATPTFGGTNPIFNWFIDSALVDSGNIFTTNSLVDGQTVSCQMISNDPCASASLVNSNGIIMTVNTSFTPSVNILGSDTICPGEIANFTAHSTNGGTIPNFQWFINGNSVTLNTPDSTYSSNTLIQGQTVSCVMTSNSSCANPLTDTSNIITIIAGTVIPSVTISFTNTDSKCQGDSIKIIASPVNGGAAPQYQWYINGIASGNNSLDSTFTSTQLTNGQIISCAMTSNSSCVNPLPTNSNSLPVAIHSLPQGILSGDTICRGDTAKLVWTSSSGISPYSFIFSNDSSLSISNVVSGIGFIASPNLDTITSNYNLISITDSIGCIRTTGITGSSAMIKVNPLPQGSISGETICLGGHGQLVWTAVPDSGLFTINYFNGTTHQSITNVTSGIPFNVTPNPVINTLYTIESVSNVCLRSNGFIDNADSIIISSQAGNNVNLMLPNANSIFCIGDSNINLILSPDQNIISYQIYSTDLTILDSIVNYSAHVLFSIPRSFTSDSAEIFISATSQTCSSDTSFWIRIDTAHFSPEVSEIKLKQPGNLLVYMDNNLNNNYESLQWGYDDSELNPFIISNQNSQVFAVNSYSDFNDKFYWVMVSNGDCVSKVYFNNPYHKISKPLMEDDEQIIVKIIPNPSGGKFEISFNGNIYGSIQERIYSPIGQLISSGTFEKPDSFISHSIDLRGLSAGLYFYEISGVDMERIVAKVLIK